MVSLAGLWEHHGVRPDAVIGHSQGEIAAAHVAGMLSLDDAARIVALRSRLVAPLVENGGMLAVALPPGRVLPPLEQWGGRREVAAENGPGSLVVAGDADALADLQSRCAEQGVFAFDVPGGFAAHSPRVADVREPLLEGLADLRPRDGGAELYSTVEGGPVDGRELDAEYWYRNLRRQVRFAEAVRSATRLRRRDAIRQARYKAHRPQHDQHHQGEGGTIPTTPPR
jgi:acyl transferase domain-containing protein